MQRKQISLLVILYGKKLSESGTLKSIINFNYKIDNLIVVNNGPNALSNEDEFLELLRLKHHSVIFKEFLENRPLSWIYNDFISQYDSDYYIFLDDDTHISKYSENLIFSLDNIDIELPKIYAIQDRKQYYPIVNGVVYSSNGLIREYSEIYSIGSGLILSKKVKELFKESNFELFDSKFALYGVDTSFFRKINYFKNKGIIFNITSSMSVDHSLSRAEGEIGEWRYIERLYDHTLSIKYYQKLRFLRLIKLLIKNISKFKYIKIILVTYFNGFHPRCVKKVKNKCHY